MKGGTIAFDAAGDFFGTNTDRIVLGHLLNIPNLQRLNQLVPHGITNGFGGGKLNWVEFISNPHNRVNGFPQSAVYYYNHRTDNQKRAILHAINATINWRYANNHTRNANFDGHLNVIKQSIRLFNAFLAVHAPPGAPALAMTEAALPLRMCPYYAGLAAPFATSANADMATAITAAGNVRIAPDIAAAKLAEAQVNAASASALTNYTSANTNHGLCRANRALPYHQEYADDNATIADSLQRLRVAERSKNIAAQAQTSVHAFILKFEAYEAAKTRKDTADAAAMANILDATLQHNAATERARTDVAQHELEQARTTITEVEIIRPIDPVAAAAMDAAAVAAEEKTRKAAAAANKATHSGVPRPKRKPNPGGGKNTKKYKTKKYKTKKMRG
jgi:hypothetical protein